MNICTFMGRLGADPEVKTTNAGTKAARFNIAVTRTWWNAKENKKEESTTWVTCIAWEKLAETVEKHLKKGQRVLVVGQYETRQYESSGEKRWAHEFRIANMDIIDWPEKTEVGAPVTPAPSASPAPAPKPSAAKPLFDEDCELPF